MRAADVIDKQTMCTFDDQCLTALQHLTPTQTTGIRLRENASQGVVARYLNVAPSTVSQGERGAKRPSGASHELLELVDKQGIRSIA